MIIDRALFAVSGPKTGLNCVFNLKKEYFLFELLNNARESYIINKNKKLYYEYTALFLFKSCLKYSVHYIMAVLSHTDTFDVTRTRIFLWDDNFVYIITRYQKHNVFRIVSYRCNINHLVTFYNST